jgi:PAS domain S-box-containing protein
MRTQNPQLGYAIAVVATVAAALFRAVYDWYFGQEPVYLIPFLIPVAVAGWMSGLRCGLFATALNAFVAVFFFIEPLYAFGISKPNETVRVAVFVVVGVVISVLNQRLHDYRHRAENHAREARVRQTILEQEIAQRSEAEQLLVAGREELRVLTEALPHIVWAARPDLTLTHLNSRGVEFTGLSADGSGPQVWVQRVHPDDRPVVSQMLEGPVARGEAHGAEFRLRRVDGVYRWVESRSVPLKDASGAVVRWIGSLSDIHDKKLAEEQLRDANATLESRVAERTAALQVSERRFRAIFHTQFQFIGLMATDGILLEANRTALAAAGVLEEDVLGKPFWETPWWIHDPLQQERLREAVRRSASGRPDRFEASHPRGDGTLMWVDFSLTPYTENGGVILLIPEGRDITERKRAEAAVRASEERFREFMAHAPIAAWVTEADGRLSYVSPGFENLLALAPGSSLGKTPADLFPQEISTRHVANNRIVLASGRVVEEEEVFLYPDGSTGVAMVAKFPMRGPSGEPQVGGVALDITAQRRAEQTARDRINASLKEKEVLLREIHHRVKNNLQIVSALLDLQSGHTDDPAVIAMFSESQGRVRSMALIHERLYLSADLTNVNFTDYVSQLAIDLYRSYKVSENEIRFDLDVDIPPLPIDIAIPCGLLLNELISNCLKHAFRHADAGTVRVGLVREADGTSVLSVSDDGAGLPAGFDLYATSSFGMQLITTLVKQLLGEITVSVATGTTFTIRFPATFETQASRASSGPGVPATASATDNSTDTDPVGVVRQ